MRKMLRNRALSLLIACFAILSHVLTPDVFSQIPGAAQMGQSAEMCHAMMATAADSQPSGKQMMKGHACCKVCVCHPAAAALITALALPVFLPVTSRFIPALVQHDAPPAIFSTKSSPRGPPSLV